jgi:hypothetical protein
MSVGTPIGTAGFKTTVVKTYQDMHPHLKRIAREDFRGREPSTQLSPAEEAAAMRATAEGRGNHASRVARTAFEAASVVAGSAISLGDARAISARLDRLEALVAAQDGVIAQLLTRLDVLDGAAPEAV